MRRLLVALLLALALPQAAGAALRPGDEAQVAVSVATLWKEPAIARSLDRPSLGNPVDTRAWDRALASADLRRWLVGRVQTQALYAERVRVLAVRGAWAEVAVEDEADPQDRRGYPGWLPLRQLVPAAPAGPEVVVGATVAWLRAPSGKRLVEVVFGTRLSLRNGVVERAGGGAAQIAASAIAPPPRATGASLVATARRFLGRPYLWGGLSPFGFDCSGLTYEVYKLHGILIPRDADPQFRAGRPVSTSALRAGDLLFYGTQSYVHHVAMYVGGGLMIEAPDSAHRVRLVPMRQRGFAGARRYF
jgi:cell wall-associated NlpC family hydrolase